jgi:CubicO group peptidase (beta-lactamase class C family)
MSKRFVKRGRILSFLFVFLFFILSSCNIHIEKEHRFEKTQKLAAEIAETYANVLGIDSLQYALMYQNEVVTQGTKERNVEDEISEINDLTIFGIGSVSKMFTAVSVMLLVDQGKINLDEPVTTYVTDFVMEDPRYQEITVRMLLNQVLITAILPIYRFSHYFLQQKSAFYCRLH